MYSGIDIELFAAPPGPSYAIALLVTQASLACRRPGVVVVRCGFQYICVPKKEKKDYTRVIPRGIDSPKNTH